MIVSLFLLLFFSIFLVVGGGTLGGVVRQGLAQGFSAGLIPAAINGLLFGVLPLCMSIAIFASNGTPYLIVVELAILVGAISVTAFVPQEYLASLTGGPASSVAFGGVFFFLGLLILVLQLSSPSPVALVVGGIFMLTGGAMVVSALVSTIKKNQAP